MGGTYPYYRSFYKNVTHSMGRRHPYYGSMWFPSPIVWVTLTHTMGQIATHTMGRATHSMAQIKLLMHILLAECHGDALPLAVTPSRSCITTTSTVASWTWSIQVEAVRLGLGVSLTRSVITASGMRRMRSGAVPLAVPA
jgi:hypothetical protein